MNWKLILGLSLFGMAMAFITLYIPATIESFCWLPVFICSAWLIARYAHKKYFLHGFLTCIGNGIWVTTVHILLSDTYIAHHAKEAAQYAKMQQTNGFTVTQSMLLLSPFIHLFFGIVLGAFSSIASKIVPR